MFIKKFSIIFVVLIVFVFSGCESDREGKIKLPPVTVSVKPESKTLPSPFPENYHPGYKTKLPEGAIYKNGKIIFKLKEPMYLSDVADLFLDYTDYYLISEMNKGLLKKNKLKSQYINKGQQIEIDNVRSFPPNPKTIVRPVDFEAKGVYITKTIARIGYVFEIAKEMKRLKLNTLVIDAKDMDGHLSYRSNIPLAKEIGATGNNISIRNLKKLREILHKDGFHVVMRQVLFHDELMAKKKPQYAPVSKKTGKLWKESGNLVWVDPSNKTIQDYHLAISRELAEMGVDEIQFDYVRFPAWGETSDAKYSFDEKKFKKHDIITDFLKKERENLAPYKVLISADVYGVAAWNQDIDMLITGQKLGDMAKYIDVICPMLYPSHFFPPFDGFSNPAAQPYHFLYDGVKRTRSKIKGTNVTIRPWIQAFAWKVPNFSPDYVYKQIKATNDSFSAGWLLWNANNEYRTGFKGVEMLKGNYPSQSDLNKKINSSKDKGLFVEKKD